ncbi:MAG: hypothetical protein A3F41_01310 [Coxiella sp. RIFCSPHIGHO2_12_FULL_44_14]|nr:MAG: hypothetical protein A3F41_01310 [Coxiella sp. RIFCSPHIGHO2_12_FULL_44_14]
MPPTPFSGLSTNAKILINEWVTLRGILLKHTTTTKESANLSATSVPTLLSDRQLDDALSGPYQGFIKQKLSAYASLGLRRLRLTLQQDEILQSEAENKETPVSEEKYTLADLDKMLSALNQLTVAHHEQWQTLLHEWDQSMITSLTQHDIPLSDIELKEWQEKAPLSELQDRFTALNLESPHPRKPEMNYADYYRLKAMLSIVSSLSRRHQAHTLTEINHVIKKLKSDFNHIQQQEKNLLETQLQETEKIIPR